MKHTTGSTIVQALEAAWSDIRAHHPELSPVTIVTGSVLTNGAWGHHWPERWAEAEAEGRTPELFIAGELFGMGAKYVLQVMLHEAAHNLAHVRGVKDTSKPGRYHNRRFVKLAEEMGLRAPDKGHPSYGYSETVITDEAQERYFSTLVELETSARHTLPDLGIRPGDENQAGSDQEDDKGKVRPITPETGVRRRRRTTGERAGKRVAMSCACTPPRKLQITPRQMDIGPIVCGVCNIQFMADE